MSCRKIKSLLVGYYEDSLETQEKNTIENHLRVCNDCKKQLKEIESLFELLKSEKTEKTEENFWINFVPEIRRKIDERSQPRSIWKPIPQLAPFLGLMIAVLVVGVILFSRDYVSMIRGIPDTDEIESYSLYGFENTTDELAEILSSVEEAEGMGTLISPDDSASILVLEEVVDDQYWDKVRLEEVLEYLSSEELDLLEKEIQKIKI